MGRLEKASLQMFPKRCLLQVQCGMWNVSKKSRATLILNSLHLLRVRYWCMFKMSTLVYKFLSSGHPSFIVHFQSSVAENTTTLERLDRRFLEVPQSCP